MAKTLIYADGSPTSVKIGDTDTDLYLQIAKDNVAVDLTAVKSITVKIADANRNYLKDISINSSNLPDGSQGILVVPLNSTNIAGLPAGSYAFEVWVETADSVQEIYPDIDMKMFTIFNNVVGGTTAIAQLTLQQFADNITDMEDDLQSKVNSGYFKGDKGDPGDKGDTGTVDNAGLTNAPAFQALQTQVNNSSVGTNLLTGTSGTLQTVTNATGWGATDFCQTNRTDLTNETYTSRAYISPASHDAAIIITVVKSSDGSSTNYWGNTVPAGSSGYSELTYTVPAGYYISQAFVSFTSDYSDSTQLSWKEMKLEKGSIATDWSPNPSEILTQTDYAKIKAAIVALGGSLS